MAPPPAHVELQRRLNATRAEHKNILSAAHKRALDELEAAMHEKEKLKGIAEQINQTLKDPRPGTEKELGKLVSDLEKQFVAVEARIRAAEGAAKVAWENYLRVDTENKVAEARKKREDNMWRGYLRATGRGGGGRRTRRKGRKAH